MPGPNSYLELASPADLMGTRMFIVAQRADTANRRLASMETGTAGDGDTNNDRMVLIYGGTKMPSGENASRMVIGNGFNAPYSNGPFPILTTLALYELQLTGTNLTILLNGVQYASGQALPAGTGAFLIKRLFASQLADASNWKGSAGDVVSLITDGSHTRQIGNSRCGGPVGGDPANEDCLSLPGLPADRPSDERRAGRSVRRACRVL